MRSNGEGVGRLTAEDLEALGGRQESLVDTVKKMMADSDERIAAAEKAAERAVVLGRAAMITAAMEPRQLDSIEGLATRIFDILEALDAEYERRYGK